MRRLRTVLLLVLAAAGLAPALPAHAGGWAVTLLDPLPDRIEADQAYTVGYWVLQHGSHPYEGELGKTGLRLVGADRELEFVGRALPEAAHFAVSVAVPAGTWRVYAMQGWFAEFPVGTLTVPGGLALAPSEVAANVTRHPEGGGEPYWGAVHPPYGAAAEVGVRPVREPAAAAPAPAAPVQEPGPRTGVAVLLLAGCALIALLVAGPARRGARLRG
ncbi:MAG TPA: hypothetical protein VE547_05635 [Mycobacteriales bacterium]|jgi:hypothetical protein|nr:hypothetical protein [Mycobacteriales bacterium]